MHIQVMLAHNAKCMYALSTSFPICTGAHTLCSYHNVNKTFSSVILSKSLDSLNFVAVATPVISTDILSLDSKHV